MKGLSPSKFQYSLVFPRYSYWTLLFLAYIIDMSGTATSSQIKLFADDSLLYRNINNQTDSDLLQRDLTILEDWENIWQMSFNAKKCIGIRIGPKKQTGEANKLQITWTYSG